MMKNLLRRAMKYSVLSTLLCFFVASMAMPQSYNDVYNSFFDSLDLLPASNAGSTVLPLLNIPLGGKRESLGTAFTALSDDSTFIEANPAGSSQLERTELAVFHNNLISTVSMESIVFGLRMGNLGLGIGGKFLHDAFTRYGSRGEQLASSLYSEGVLTLNASYTFLSGFYFSGISLGINGKFAYQSIPKELYKGVAGLDGREQSAFALMADIGLLTRFDFLKGYSGRDKNFSIGLVLLNLGPDLDKDHPLPTRLNAGIAYRPLRFLQLTSDFILPINFSRPEQRESPGLAFGLGFQFTDFLALRTGLLFFGGNPRITIGTELRLDDFSISANYTLDRTTQLGKLDRFSLQLSLNLGDEGRLSIQQRVDALYLEALLALASSDYLAVIRLCHEALELDSGFTPAKELLTSAEESYSLEQELERLRQAN